MGSQSCPPEVARHKGVRLAIASSCPNVSAPAQKHAYPKQALEIGIHDRERNRGMEVLSYRKGETGTQLAVEMPRLGKFFQCEQ